jgi:glycerate kinase
MRYLIAPDKFKGCLSARQAAQALAEGIEEADSQAEICLMPLADGGEGFAEAYAALCPGHWVFAEVHDPLFRPRPAAYWLSADGREACIEMAAASGLQLLAPAERNVLRATSLGTGELILDAIARGARHIRVALGGSATCDGGLGLAAALGFVAYDAEGRELPPSGEGLCQLDHWRRGEASALPPDLRATVLHDVSNPLWGDEGAAWVFAPQKGAPEGSLPRLDAGLRRIGELLAQHAGRKIAHLPGAGAAGGMGAALYGLMNAEQASGADFLLDAGKFEAKAGGCDWIFTGEGRLDRQTGSGKAVAAVARRAAPLGVPVLAFCGELQLSPREVRELGLRFACPIQPRPASLSESLAQAEDWLRQAGARVAGLLAAGNIR